MSQIDNCGKAKSQWTEKMLWSKAVLLQLLYITIKGGDKEGHVKYIGDKLRGREKAKWGNLRD